MSPFLCSFLFVLGPCIHVYHLSLLPQSESRKLHKMIIHLQMPPRLPGLPQAQPQPQRILGSQDDHSTIPKLLLPWLLGNSQFIFRTHSLSRSSKSSSATYRIYPFACSSCWSPNISYEGWEVYRQSTKSLLLPRLQRSHRGTKLCVPRLACVENSAAYAKEPLLPLAIQLLPSGTSCGKRSCCTRWPQEKSHGAPRPHLLLPSLELISHG